MNCSDSFVQKEIEKIALEKIGLSSKKIKVKDVAFCFDGFSEEKAIVVEIYAGIKTLKSAQKQKVSQDILKMIFFEALQEKKYNKKFVVIDREIYNQLQYRESKTWRNLSLEYYGINIEYVKLDKTDYNRIVEAKKLQGEKFKNK